MVNLHYSNSYRIVHFTNEIGKYIIGGIASFMNELYDDHPSDTGFVHIYDPEQVTEIEIAKYPGQSDIVAVSQLEASRLSDLQFDVAVVHFYRLSLWLDEHILQNRPLVYVVHSVPTAEPFMPDDPFGSNDDIQAQFEFCCGRASRIVCISKAEADKLVGMYPELESKIVIIPNGMRFSPNFDTVREIREFRDSFGFIGRLDYRKGLLECMRAFRRIEGKLNVACGREDPSYMSQMLLFIDGAAMQDKVHFLGWCQGARKQSFLHSLDALIVPSLYEPFGYVVLEAMEAGIPLICSNRGGIPEIVGDSPFLFDPYEPGSLERVVRQFQQVSPSVIQEEVERLQERRQYFGASRMRQDYRKLLEQFN